MDPLIVKRMYASRDVSRCPACGGDMIREVDGESESGKWENCLTCGVRIPLEGGFTLVKSHEKSLP